VLPCGPVPANPTEVLNSQEFNDTIEVWPTGTTWVLLDSPPVSGVGRRPGDRRQLRRDADRADGPAGAPASTETTRDALQGVRGTDHRAGRQRTSPQGGSALRGV
jgi:hypothetical protein